MKQNTSEKPLVSVLMCVYNGEKYLKEAIDSILNQTYHKFEFIIINDGSTDSTENIIQGFDDKRIKYHRNEVNLKLIASLNKGLRICSGKYIARMDADDIAFPNRIETQVNFLDNHPDAGAVGSFVETAGLKENRVIRFKTKPEEIKFKLFFANHLFHPTVMLNSQVLKRNYLEYKNYLHAEDYKLWIDLSRVSNLYIIPEVLLRYRLHGENISTTNSAAQEEISCQLRKEQFKELQIVLSQEEEKTYNEWLEGKNILDSITLEMLLSIFNILIENNNKIGLFDKSLFNAYYSSKSWEVVCLNVTNGIKTYNSFKSKSYLNAPTKALEIKLLLKCLTNIF